MTDRGPLRSYEIVWSSGHVETIHAHQVTMPLPDLGVGLGFSTTKTERRDFIRFHAEIDGHWGLVMAVKPELIDAIRDKATEEKP